MVNRVFQPFANVLASPNWPHLEFDAVACQGHEHFFGGIVEVVVLDAVMKEGKKRKAEKVSAGLDGRKKG